ncbi:hypothetical protein O181_034463 [Austropuccinia psidii MF-1]|uniref:GST N-terminal domain-containing protein n=1 Tax=Austropuccinia psidii MF-1 TaxID=1389203 RepID=A0A9Q3D3I5_9BASI|nr:hypothetical protein [Austropuccinia psidii MF-1]
MITHHQNPSEFHPNHNLSSISSSLNSSQLVLVADKSSPFSQRVVIALKNRKIDYDYQEATHTQKAIDKTASNPTQYLPFLIYHNQIVLGGSVNLIQFLEEAYPDHLPHLLSSDPIQRSHQRLWSDYIRQYAVPLFLKTMRARLNSYKSDSTILAGLGKVLSTYGQACLGPFFAGDQLTLPDILIAPFVFQARFTTFPKLATKASNPIDSKAGKRYQEYAQSILNCPILKEILVKNDISLEHLQLQTQPILPPSPTLASLPSEIITQIINEIGDYELAETLGLPHHVPITSAWDELATPLDRAILSSRLSQVVHIYSVERQVRFSTWGARVMVRFGYIEILDYLFSVEPNQLRQLCNYLLPDVASAWGRVKVLEWALQGGFGIPDNASETAINEATANGHLATLEWWKNSGLPLTIGNVMDYASQEGTTVSLEWWAQSGLEGKYSRLALLYASNQGNIKVLDWWLNSGLQLVYDKEVLIGATKHGKAESLEWWLQSGLSVPYTIFDIEEAIEDCTHAQDKVNNWWMKQGIHQKGSAIDWTHVRILGKNQK